MLKAGSKAQGKSPVLSFSIFRIQVQMFNEVFSSILALNDTLVFWFYPSLVFFFQSKFRDFYELAVAMARKLCVGGRGTLTQLC